MEHGAYYIERAKTKLAFGFCFFFFWFVFMSEKELSKLS